MAGMNYPRGFEYISASEIWKFPWILVKIHVDFTKSTWIRSKKNLTRIHGDFVKSTWISLEFCGIHVDFTRILILVEKVTDRSINQFQTCFHKSYLPLRKFYLHLFYLPHGKSYLPPEKVTCRCR